MLLSELPDLVLLCLPDDSSEDALHLLSIAEVVVGGSDNQTTVLPKCILRAFPTMLVRAI